MNSEQQVDLDALMARLAEGDRSAFASVFRILWPPILRLGSRMLGSEADAADAAQQALVKVLTRAGEYDCSRPALPWALGIAAWECRTLLRKRARAREAPAEQAPLAATSSSEDEFEQHELLETVRAALGELSNSDREALVATFWEEAASVSGATLRKRRERALKRLRDIMRRLYGLD